MLIREVLNFNILSDLMSWCPIDQPELLILIKSILVYSVRIGSEIRTIWKVKVYVYKIQEFYSPILGPARAYKDDAHERREIQTIEWKRVLAITMYDIFVPEI